MKTNNETVIDLPLTSISRRNLLKTILYASPALMFTKGGLFADGNITPLNPPVIVPKGRKIRMAQIGVFNRGNSLRNSFGNFSDQMEYVAFADVSFTKHDSSIKKYPGVPCFKDYREMFENLHEKIDAVIVATPDHTHFAPAIHSMLLGKHVYVEKPLAHTVEECRMLRKVAKACGVSTQMGNQGYSKVGIIQLQEWVDAGVVKDVRKIDAWMCGNRRWHGWKYTTYPKQTPAPGYDWDLWLNRSEFRPHSNKLTGGNWRGWFQFGSGALGDWGAHIMDAAYTAFKLDQPYEISTKLIGSSDILYPQGSVITFKFAARGNMPPLELNWYDGKTNYPEKPAGFTGQMNNTGTFIYGSNNVVKGVNKGQPHHVIPYEKERELLKAGKLPKPERRKSGHYQNFLNACQGIEKTNSPFEFSARLSELLCLGCIGQRFGGTLKYDSDRMKITNNPEADKMLRGDTPRSRWTGYYKGKTEISKHARILNPASAKWTPLFDGSSLDAWENPYSWGKADIVDNEIILSSEKGKWFLLTKKTYSNFVFEAEIKMPVKKGNSGILFRCLKEKNKAWGYQAEVDTSERGWSGGLYDEGRRSWFSSPIKGDDASVAAFRKRAGDCFKQGEWNHYKISCIEDHIQIWVNGTLTTDTYDNLDIDGYIGLQHHGEKGLNYSFRNIRIKDLGYGGEIFYPHRS